jgi:hypothetical protein
LSLVFLNKETQNFPSSNATQFQSQ